jgi:hypothetical protein
MDAGVRLDAMRTAKPCGPGLPTLRSSSQTMMLRATVAIKPDTGESAA